MDKFNAMLSPLITVRSVLNIVLHTFLTSFCLVFEHIRKILSIVAIHIAVAIFIFSCVANVIAGEIDQPLNQTLKTPSGQLEKKNAVRLTENQLEEKLLQAIALPDTQMRREELEKIFGMNLEPITNPIANFNNSNSKDFASRHDENSYFEIGFSTENQNWKIFTFSWLKENETVFVSPPSDICIGASDFASRAQKLGWRFVSYTRSGRSPQGQLFSRSARERLRILYTEPTFDWGSCLISVSDYSSDMNAKLLTSPNQ